MSKYIIFGLSRSLLGICYVRADKITVRILRSSSVWGKKKVFPPVLPKAHTYE